MSQQINLLAPRAHEDRYLQRTGLGLGLVLLAIAGWWGLLRYETHQAQAQVDVQARQLARVQAQMNPAGNEARAVLETEIQALRVEAAALKDFLGAIRQADLGRQSGYASVLEELARVPHPETWLTQIDLRAQGVPMTLTGAGLSDHAIANYAAAINRQFAQQGIELRSLELARPGNTPTPISFKLF